MLSIQLILVEEIHQRYTPAAVFHPLNVSRRKSYLYFMDGCSEKRLELKAGMHSASALSPKGELSSVLSCFMSSSEVTVELYFKH